MASRASSSFKTTSSSGSSSLDSSPSKLASSRSFLSKQRLLVALLVCTLLLDFGSLAAEARPQDDPTSVAEAIRLLQELESKHAQHARPRFGKRGYLSPVGYGGQDEQEDVWQDSTFAR